jgi:hypothetical protein
LEKYAVVVVISRTVQWGHRITVLCNKIKVLGGHIGDIAAMAMLKRGVMAGGETGKEKRECVD